MNQTEFCIFFQNFVFEKISQNPSGHYIIIMPRRCGKTRILLRLAEHFGNVHAHTSGLRIFETFKTYHKEDSRFYLMDDIQQVFDFEGLQIPDQNWPFDLHVNTSSDGDSFNFKNFRTINYGNSFYFAHTSFPYVLKDRVKRAILCFLCIWRFNKRSYMINIPREIVLLISEMIWTTVYDGSWETFKLISKENRVLVSKKRKTTK